MCNYEVIIMLKLGKGQLTISYVKFMIRMLNIYHSRLS